MNLRTIKVVVCAPAIASYATNESRVTWSRPKYASLTLENACDSFRELKDWWSRHEEGVIWVCNDHYNKRNDYILKSLASCIPASRNKRSPTLTALGAVAVDVIGTGVTNFVKSYFSPGRLQDSPKTEADMIYDLKKQTLSILEARESRKQEISKAVVAFSDSSQFHHDEIEVEAAQIDNQYSASMQLFLENIAKFANLRAIDNQCRAGRMATRELSELLGDRELMEINSYETRIDNVLVNKETKKIHFIFRVKEEASQAEAHNVTSSNNFIDMAKLLNEINRTNI